MKFEVESMYSNKVWTLMDAIKGITPIRCKWVFKRNIRANNNVGTYKAKLVTKGFKQKHDVDYNETLPSRFCLL